MFYRPEKGRIWDPTVVKYGGIYHMFTMYYEEDQAESYSMRLATSSDGVHWKDRGNVLKDEKPIWKMGIYRLADGRFAMNHGSLSGKPGHGNDTLRYYVSKNLINWEPVYSNNPDPKWYEEAERWDHMYVIESEQSGYIGYTVATPKAEIGGAIGIQRSSDGIHFSACKPPEFEFGDIEPTREIEVGGCEKIGGKYYLIGGICPPYNGNYGYSVYTMVADNENGPFRPDDKAFRLCGFSGMRGKLFVQVLAAFCRNYDDDNLLVSNTIWYEHDSEKRCIWALPLRQAVTDCDGHLRLGYFKGNDAVKGRALKPDLRISRVLMSDGGECMYGETEKAAASADGELKARGNFQCDERAQNLKDRAVVFAGANFAHIKTAALPEYQLDNRRLVFELAETDFDKGVFLEGEITISPHPARQPVRAGCWMPSMAGFFFGSSEKSGTAIILEAAPKSNRRSYVGRLSLEDAYKFEIEDTANPNCATVTGLDCGVKHSFKLLIRYGMFELYVDDLLVQSYVMQEKPNGKIALVLKNAEFELSNLNMYEMNL